MVNKVILQGRLVGNPKLQTVNNKQWCEFTLAVHMAWRKGEGFKNATYFIPCVVYGLPAERVAENRSKGDVVLVEGFLHQYMNSIRVVVEKLTLLKAVHSEVKEETMEGEERMEVEEVKDEG